MFNEDTGEVDETARGGYLGNVVECALPAYPLGLLVLGENAHVGAVGSYVVGGTAQGDDGQHGHGDSEEVGQM